MPNMDTSYLTTQVTTIIGQLHGLFDDIGVETHERESREAEVRCHTQNKLWQLLINYIPALCCAFRNLEQSVAARDSVCVLPSFV